MNIEEIKKGAPLGATHYHDIFNRRVFYIKFINQTAYYWDSWLKTWLCYNMPYELKPL